MGIESGSFISQLNAAWPLPVDNVSQGDDHLRLIKSVLQATFPGAGGGLSAAVNATAAELSLVSGATANIQAQLNTHTTNIATNTADIASTATALAALNTQVALKANIASPALTGVPTAPTAAANNSTTQIATTAFANPGASLSSNGYVKLPSGIIIQWGGLTLGAAPFAVTFPIAFPLGNIFGVLCTPGTTASSVFVGVSGQTASGFTLNGVVWNGSAFTSAAGIPAFWAAIGA